MKKYKLNVWNNSIVATTTTFSQPPSHRAMQNPTAALSSLSDPRLSIPFLVLKLMLYITL